MVLIKGGRKEKKELKEKESELYLLKSGMPS
jgi:hypothetical protein